MTDRIDDLRKTFPKLGFALYAIEPGRPVTFEVYDGDDVFTFRGKSETEAINKAFPPMVEVTEEPIPEIKTTNVFD